MKLEHQSPETIREEILAVISKYLDVKQYKIFFFGSRVSGASHERSDIDVGIEGLKPIPLTVMSDIEEEIEKIPTLYKIDIVDFGRVGGKFKSIAKEKIELLTKQQ